MMKKEEQTEETRRGVVYFGGHDFTECVPSLGFSRVV